MTLSEKRQRSLKTCIFFTKYLFSVRTAPEVEVVAETEHEMVGPSRKVKGNHLGIGTAGTVELQY